MLLSVGIQNEPRPQLLAIIETLLTLVKHLAACWEIWFEMMLCGFREWSGVREGRNDHAIKDYIMFQSSLIKLSNGVPGRQ